MISKPATRPPLPPLFKGGKRNAERAIFIPSLHGDVPLSSGAAVLPPLKRGGRGGPRTLGHTLLLLILAAIPALSLNSAHAEDVVILKDGKAMEGAITRETDDTIFIRENNGEEHGIDRADIAKVQRAKAAAAKNLAPDAAKKAGAVPATPASTAALIDKVNGLGSNVLAERKAAADTIKANGTAMLPVLLGMLDPKQKTPELTRVAILRILADFAPLDDPSSRTLAFDSVYDPYFEARREACHTIKKLQDDVAIAELAKYLSAQDPAVRSAAAFAVRELNDTRLMLALIKSIPIPEVTANNGPVTTNTRGVPRGNGMTGPVTTGSQEVSGVAQNTDSPGAQMIQLIAGKNLGNLPYAWLSWYGELTSQISSADYSKHNSARSKMNKSSNIVGNGTSSP